MILLLLLLLMGIGMIYLGAECLVWSGNQLAAFTSADDRKGACFFQTCCQLQGFKILIFITQYRYDSSFNSMGISVYFMSQTGCSSEIASFAWSG